MFSLESPHRGDSNEYTQYTIFQYKKENHPNLSKICNYGICSKGPKNEFETAVVNEPSVFKPLKLYCILTTCMSCCIMEIKVRPMAISFFFMSIFRFSRQIFDIQVVFKGNVHAGIFELCMHIDSE